MNVIKELSCGIYGKLCMTNSCQTINTILVFAFSMFRLKALRGEIAAVDHLVCTCMELNDEEETPFLQQSLLKQ